MRATAWRSGARETEKKKEGAGGLSREQMRIRVQQRLPEKYLISHAGAEPACQLKINIKDPGHFCHVGLVADLLQVQAAAACAEDAEKKNESFIFVSACMFPFWCRQRAGPLTIPCTHCMSPWRHRGNPVVKTEKKAGLAVTEKKASEKNAEQETHLTLV